MKNRVYRKAMHHCVTEGRLAGKLPPLPDEVRVEAIRRLRNMEKNGAQAFKKEPGEYYVTLLWAYSTYNGFPEVNTRPVCKFRIPIEKVRQELAKSVVRETLGTIADDLENIGIDNDNAT